MLVLNIARRWESALPASPTPAVHRDGSTSLVSNPTDFPDPLEFASGGRVKAVLEPIVKASIIVPESASFATSAPPPRLRFAHFTPLVLLPAVIPAPSANALRLATSPSTTMHLGLRRPPDNASPSTLTSTSALHIRILHACARARRASNRVLQCDDGFVLRASWDGPRLAATGHSGAGDRCHHRRRLSCGSSNCDGDGGPGANAYDVAPGRDRDGLL